MRLGLLMVGLLLTLIACARVSVLPEAFPSPERSSGTPLALGAVAKGPDIAVTAIDFDPPLRPNTTIASGDISLLAAVENKGDRTEKDIRVVAQIYGKEEELLYSNAQDLAGLAAGEGRVVNLGRLSGLPLRPAYTLRVWALPVPGENRLGNNDRTYHIQVSISTP